MAYAVPAGAGLFDSAPALMRAGELAVGNGETEIDLGAVTECDSSLLACVLSWRRAATARGAHLAVKNAPENLGRIARLYGVETLALQ
jgi:ABC-type transporter Mla MlaB component